MKIKSLLIYCGLFAGVFIFSMTGYICGVGRNEEKALPPAVSAKEKEIPDVFLAGSDAAASRLTEKLKEKYILRENENKVSLFIRYSNGDEHIHSEYEIAVNLLPKSDRERLKEGIEFNSVDDVIKFIEDYMG